MCVCVRAWFCEGWLRVYHPNREMLKGLHRVTGLLLLVHLLRYLLPEHLLLGTICFCVIVATIVQMLLRTPKFLKAIHDHNQLKQLRNLIDSVRYAHQKQNSKQH